MSTFGTRRKLMSISRAEFAASARGLDPAVGLSDEGETCLARFALADGGFASVRCEPRAPRVIGGGLLSLPQADVTLTFEGTHPAAEEAFLKRFEICFQRGGG
jgi:hypothetical protein